MLDDDVFKGYRHSQWHWPNFLLWSMKTLYQGFRKVKQNQKDIWPVSFCLLMDRRGKCKPDVWMGMETSGNYWIHRCSGNGLAQWLTYLEVRSWSQSSTSREDVTGELEHSCLGPILSSKFTTDLNEKAQTFYFIYLFFTSPLERWWTSLVAMLEIRKTTAICKRWSIIRKWSLPPKLERCQGKRERWTYC